MRPGAPNFPNCCSDRPMLMALVFGLLVAIGSFAADALASWPWLKWLAPAGLAALLYYLDCRYRRPPTPQAVEAATPPELTRSERLHRITLLYACLTETNQAIVRCQDKNTLLPEICRAFVDKAETLGALIYLWQGQSATSGIGAEVLDRLTKRGPEEFDTILNQLRNGETIVFNQFTPDSPAWTEVFAPLGAHSLAAYPMRQGDEIVGVLAVYAADVGWFDQEMCALLEELAQDVAFALENLAREAARQQAETELRRSRTKLERAEAIAHVGHWERRLDGYVAWSDETYRIFGLRPQEKPVSREELMNMIHPDDRPKVQAVFDNCFLQGATYDVEYRIFRPDGSLRYLHSQGGLVGDSTEGATLFGAVLDITEHRLALDALRKSEESLALAVEAAGLGLWDTHIESRRLVVNAEFARMLGYTPEELADLDHDKMIAMVHPDDLERLIDSVKYNVEGLVGHFEAEVRLKHKEGHWVWSLGRGQVTERDSQGQPLRLSGTQIDITDRKQSDDLLRLLYRAVEQSPASIAITDTNGNIEYVNQRFAEVTGYSRMEAIGQNPRIIKSGFTPLPTYEDLWATIKAGGTWRGRLQNRKKNGKLYWESAIIQGICNEHGEVVNFLAIKEDITDRMEVERQIRELNATLEQRVADRNQALIQANKDLESFSYSVSHDLRAPLRAITGFSQILLESEQDNLTDDGKRMLERVAINGQRMANLIDDILEYSRAGRGEPRLADLDLGRMARDIANELSSNNPKAVLNIANLPPAKGDSTMLRQIMSNLIGNALKFTLHRSEPVIEIGATEREGKTVYFVRDNGAGFDMQYATHLFGMFQRLHGAQEFPGTGVGLAIVKRLVERHGGQIWAESKPDEGATFSFTLG